MAAAKICPACCCAQFIELHTGHSIVSRAVLTGLETAVKEMLRVMENYLA